MIISSKYRQSVVFIVLANKDIEQCPDGSVAEHFLGKEEVGGSIPLMGST